MVAKIEMIFLFANIIIRIVKLVISDASAESVGK